MAIAVDTTTNPDAGGGSVGASPYTWSHTTSGSNRLLVVLTLTRNGTTPPTVTYNSVSMTQVGTIQLASGDDTYTSFFALTNPTSGSNTISVSFGGTYLRVAAASYTGVAQSGQPEAQGQSISTATQAVTTLTDNAWLIGITADTAASTNTTNRVTSGGNTGYFIIDSNAPQTPAGSHSLNVTSSTAASLNVASFAPYVASVTDGNFLMFM